MFERPLRFKRGDRGPFVADAQAMLAKLGFDPGEPSGTFVSKTEDAVRAFQREYGLEVTGILDCTTFRLLYDEADPGGYPAVLIEGAEPPQGPPPGPGEGDPKPEGEDGELSLDLQGEDQVEEESIPPPGTAAGIRAAAQSESSKGTIVISVGERALGLYEDGRLVRRYPVAIGKASTPTPVGSHRVLEKVMHPGGALGTRWMAFTYEMHGIHGTNHPELIGQAVSNGCVRMHNPDVEELYNMVEVGTPVAVIAGALKSWPGLGKSTGQAPGQPAGKAGGKTEQAGIGQGISPASGGAGQPGGTLGPGSPPPKDTPGAPSGRTHVVQPGDSLWSIAQRFGTTVDAIARANNLRNPDLIYPGEILVIP